MATTRTGKLSELTPDHSNANRGTERGRYALEASLRKYGAGRSILIDRNGRIIAGNKTAETAADVGIDDVIVVQTDGRQVVAVQRTDLDLDSNEARELAYADNRVGQLDLDFDPAQILADLNAGVNLDQFWRKDELDELLADLQPKTDEDETYSREIKSPVYKPSNAKPQVSELFDDTKTKELIQAIQAAEGLTDEEREFLTAAARRHTVFHFNKIADFYAHASESTQALMEDSALVIIDFGRAIDLGYVKLAEEIAKQYGADYGDA